LDLQGGISFLVKMDTSSLTNENDLDAALSQAVEVLRKRVDRFGVAEPLIQPAGENSILIQLPGLLLPTRRLPGIPLRKRRFSSSAW
jgi:preprotein translocase subunit SecD